MRAVRQTAAGELGLAIEDIPEPPIGGDELLLRVSTVGVNQLDLNVIRGVGPGLAAALPRTLGIDPAGVVVAQGPEVAGDRVGSRVVVKPNIPCGSCAFCTAQREADCPAQTVLGVHRDGGAAEFVAVPSRNVFDIGDLDFADATAAVHSVPIALHAIHAAGGIEPGMTVLVSGASGALGQAVVQLAVLAGARVVATSRRETPPRAGVTELRAATPGDLPDLLAEHAPGGFDVTIDTSGHAGNVAVALEQLAWGGTAVAVAASVESSLQLDLRRFYLRRNRLVGAASADYAEVAEGLDLVRTGRLDVTIDSRRPLSDAHDAYLRFESGENSGKVIIDVE